MILSPTIFRSIRRHNLTNEITEDKNYIQESAVFMREESHGAEDVPIYGNCSDLSNLI